ncbi:MAG: hypothetical protein GEV09_18515 [Pseudonocardiaceae bacterium]|nr:hypothetical protein [Pseudonocardiaceae bacterium]
MATKLDALPVRDRPTRRFAQLLAGLLLYGTSMAMQVRATLGLNQRDVLHEGIMLRTPLTFGMVTALTGLVVLLTWIPLRVVRTGIEAAVLSTGWLLGGTVGLGTVLYALAIGPLTQAFLRSGTT